ncbi:Alpha-ketoglutaric semialdehyde dehydrogenase 1 [Usitatibacter rugosus]|uniref:Alpha-ketoglutaric semialdehyde dehydrogenase 1 n=1 Tax=Usitatibacter rugosus TaxID=2732067 RepID=A0A6M4GZ15_9PROT|nr:NAD-dependent succinate-semialdehyde dehydrogenase [Usitatibacter rugosus]QJR12275.1 Alpha-ketoglutaric semialdehyde dehydrogenase 1 [Usitatibacter rugosus]
MSALPRTPQPVSTTVPKPQLYIDGKWVEGESTIEIAIVDPATGATLAKGRGASDAQVDAAAAAAARAFAAWAAMPAYDRGQILRSAAAKLRANADELARVMTLEQGKPFAEAKAEILGSCEIIEWNADEGRRLYGRLVPSRQSNVQVQVVHEPVGPVAAFTPWNFPMTTPVRKITGSLAAGCTCVIKPAEETPLTCLAIVRALEESGLPAGVLNVVYGDAAAISTRLIDNPAIRKISFTGSTRVGRMLAEHAGRMLKKATLELGGHAPVVVFEDADLERAVPQIMALKYKNAGQICISPTRFIVHEKIFAPFVERFANTATSLKVGPGLDEKTTMGPLANGRRATAITSLIDDAVKAGATIAAQGSAPEGGHFRGPTVLTKIPLTARVMTEEPFGPLALVNSFKTFDEAMAEANRLPYGLASYVFTRDLANAQRSAAAIESGMVAFNSARVAWPEAPFGGVKDSGSGSEGGSEGLEGYTVTKTVSLSW